MTDREMQIKIEVKIPDIVKSLKCGKEIEIHTAKDGIKIYATDRKVI